MSALAGVDLDALIRDAVSQSGPAMPTAGRAPRPEQVSPADPLDDLIRSAVAQENGGVLSDTDQAVPGASRYERFQYDASGRMPVERESDPTTLEGFRAGAGNSMRAMPDDDFVEGLLRGAQHGWVEQGPPAITGGRNRAHFMRPGEGVGGFIGETAGGLAGGLLNPGKAAENVLGYLTGAEAVSIAKPMLGRVAKVAGPRVAGMLEHAIGGAGGMAPLAGLQRASEIPLDVWASHPLDSTSEVLKAMGVGAGLGAGVGGVTGAMGKFTPHEGVRPGVVEHMGSAFGLEPVGAIDPRLTPEAALAQRGALEALGGGELGTRTAGATLDDLIGQAVSRERAGMTPDAGMEPSTAGASSPSERGAGDAFNAQGGVTTPAESATPFPQTDRTGSQPLAPGDVIPANPALPANPAIPVRPKVVPTVPELRRLTMPELRAKASERGITDPEASKGLLVNRILDTYREAEPPPDVAASRVEPDRLTNPPEKSVVVESPPVSTEADLRRMPWADLQDHARSLGVEEPFESKGKLVPRVLEAQEAAREKSKMSRAAAGEGSGEAAGVRDPAQVRAVADRADDAGTPRVVDEGVPRVVEGERPPAGGKSGDVGSIADRIIATADRIEKAALERKAKRQIPRGRDTGAAINPFAEVRDAAAIAAARAAKAGVKGGKALAELVDSVVKEHYPHLAEKVGTIARSAGRLVRGSLDEAGNHNPDQLEMAVGAMLDARRNRKVGTVVREAVGLKDTSGEVKTTEARQLRRDLKSQERAAREGFKAGVAEGRAREQAAANPAESVKARVMRTTGVRPEQRMIPEHQALTASMRKAEQAGRAAYRLGRREARAEARLEANELRDTLMSDARAQRNVETGLRAEARRLAEEHLPLQVRGKVLSVVDRATTPRRLARAVERIRTELLRWEGRDSVGETGRTLRRALKKPDAGLMREFQGTFTKTPPGPDANIKRADLREAAKKWAMDIRERIGSTDARVVAAARDEAVEVLHGIQEQYHAFKRSNRVILEGKQVEAQQLRDDLAKNLRTVKPVRRAAGAIDATERADDGPVRTYFRKQMTDDTVALRLDGGKADGPVQRLLIGPLWDAESQWQGRLRDFQDGLRTIVEKHGWKSIGAAMAEVSGTSGKASQRMVRVKLGDFETISLGQAMEILAVDKTTGGRVGRGNAVVFRTRPNTPVEITPEAMERIRAAVGPKGVALMDDIAKLTTEQLQDDLFKALRRIKGWEPERVDWYHPTSRKMELSYDPDKYNGWSGAMTAAHLEDAGFTKNRQGGTTPYVIGDYFDTINHHSRMSAAIIEMAEPIRTAEMVILHPETRPLLADRFGDVAVRRIEQRLRSASELGKYDVGAEVDRWFLRAIQHTSRALTALSERVWLKQLGGVASISSEMSPRSFTAGLKVLENPAESRRIYQEMVRESGFFWNRWAVQPSALMSGLGETSLMSMSRGNAKQAIVASARSLRKGRPVESFHQAMRVFDSIRVAAYADSLPARVAWAGLKGEAEALHPNWSPEQKLAWVRKNAEAAVRRTQNSFSVLDSSELTQDARKSALKAAFVAFTGDSNKALNQIVRARTSGSGKRLAGVVAVRAINALWSAAVSAGMPYMVWTIASHFSSKSAGREQAAERAKAQFANNLTRDLLGTVWGLDRLYDLITAGGNLTKDPLQSPTGSEVAQVATGLGQFVTGVYDRASAAGDADPVKVERATDKYIKGLENVASGSMVLSGVPLTPVIRNVQTARKALNATYVNDLAYERRKLRSVPERSRTLEQRRRLAVLDAWESANSDISEAKNTLVKRGMKSRAEEMEARREIVAKRFKERLESEAVAQRPKQ